MSNAAFRVPADLADLDISLSKVQEILANRRRLAVVQARIDGLPKKARNLETELAKIRALEESYMAAARGETAEATS